MFWLLSRDIDMSRIVDCGEEKVQKLMKKFILQ
jgi:hypothetical protein